jgi:hypothetical protein
MSREFCLETAMRTGEFGVSGEPSSAKLQNSLLISLLAGNPAGDRSDHDCVASQAVRSLEESDPASQRSRRHGAFRRSSKSLTFPKAENPRARRRKSPSVRGNIPEFERRNAETGFDRRLRRRGAGVGISSAALFNGIAARQV